MRQRIDDRSKKIDAIRELWRRPGVARVIDKKYGEIVVPCSSKLSALICAAAVWGCHWTKIKDAEVMAVEDGEKPVPLPEKYK